MTVIPIFISSTFRDFHRERDALHRTVLPSVNAALADRDLSVTLVDLRWGVSLGASDSERKRARSILTICAREIDRCQPLVLGLVGDYYGWTPELKHVRRFLPPIDGSDGERSITDLELRYAMRHGGSAPLVFHRRRATLGPDGGAQPVDRRIGELVDFCRANAALLEYGTAVGPTGALDVSAFVALATPAIIDWVGVASARHAVVRTGGPNGQTAGSHLAGRNREQQDLQTALVTDSRRAVVSGESGIGKTALVDAVAERLAHDGWVVVRHRVTPVRPAEREIAATIADVLGEPPIAGDAVAAMRAMTPALRRFGRLLLVIDSAEHLAPGEDHNRLRSLLRLPSEVSVVVTTTDKGQTTTLSRAGFIDIAVGPIRSEDISAAVESTLAYHGRELAPTAVAVISAHPRSGLWLRLVTDLLLALGEETYVRAAAHADPDIGLAAEITQIVKTLPDDEHDLVAFLLERAEQMYGSASIERLMSTVMASPGGVIGIDRLNEATGLPTAAISELRYSLGSSIIDIDLKSQAAVKHEIVANGASQRYRDGVVAAHLDLREFHRRNLGSDSSVVSSFVHHSLHSCAWSDALHGIERAESTANLANTSTVDVVIEFMTVALEARFAAWLTAVSQCSKLLAVRQLVQIVRDVDARRLTADRHLRLCLALLEAPATEEYRQDLSDPSAVDLGIAAALLALRAGDADVATREAIAAARLAGRQRKVNPSPDAEQRTATALLLYLRTFFGWFSESMHSTNCKNSAQVLNDLEQHVRAIEGSVAAGILADVLETRLRLCGRCRTTVALGTPGRAFAELVSIRRSAFEIEQNESATEALALALLRSHDAFPIEGDRLEHLAEAKRLFDELVRFDSGSAQYVLGLAQVQRARSIAFSTDISLDSEMRGASASAGDLAKSLVSSELRTAHDLEAAIAVLAETGAANLMYRRTDRDQWMSDVEAGIVALESALDLAEGQGIPLALQVAAGHKICGWFPHQIDRLSHDLRFGASTVLRARFGLRAWTRLEEIAHQRNRLLAIWTRAADLTGRPDTDMAGYKMLETRADIEQVGRSMLQTSR